MDVETIILLLGLLISAVNLGITIGNNSKKWLTLDPFVKNQLRFFLTH